MKPAIAFLSLFIFIIPVPLSSAGGAIEEIKQRQLMEEQQQIQQAIVEKAIVERQQQEMVAQYMAAYQQAAVQQYVQSQQQAIAVAAAQQQAVAQYMAQQMALEMAAYQAAVARRQQTLAQEQVLRIKTVQNSQYRQVLMNQQAQQYLQQAAVAQAVASRQKQTLAEYQQAILAKEIGEKAAYEQVQAIRDARTIQDAQEIAAYQAATVMREKDRNKLYEDIPSSFVKDVVPVSELWKSLDTSSRAWVLLIDKKAKGVTISHYIEQLAKEGGVIHQDPLHYAQIIDDMSSQNSQMLQQPFKDLLTVVAIIEYDFDNGVDKNILARKVFPDERTFQSNKQRLGK